MTNMKHFFVLLLSLFASPVLAQGVQQSGTVTPGHASYWVTSGVQADGGSAADSPITSIGVTNNGGNGICVSSARQTAVGRNQLCLGASTTGPAVISLQNYGTAAAQSLQFMINGTPVTIPTGGANIILGNPPFTSGDLSCFLNTSGVLIDCGIAAGGGVITAGIWAGTPIAVIHGGTGGTSPASAQAGLGLGSLATQNANNVAITGGTITGLPTPTNPTDAAIKSYVDGLATGLIILAPTSLATAAVLPNTPTYANGSSGVGATLTAGTNSTLTVDGTVAVLNTVVLVKNQAAPAQNGIYTVTTAGSGAAAWVLTRATYFNQASNMLAGSYTFVNSGSANINSSYVLSATVTTVGTTTVNFNQFSSTGAGVTNIDSKNGTFTTGNGVTSTSGNVIQLTNASTPAREAILSGGVDTTGFSNFASAGSGLNVNLAATATPLTMSFAYGFNAVTGSVDYVGQLAADATSYWASVPANQYSFLSVDRNVSTGALTATQTPMRPQRGPVFYAPRQALLHFENNLNDDWGNAWASIGATFSNSTVKFGSFSLRLNGSSSYAQTAAILNPGQVAWTMDVWANLDSNVNANIFSVGNSFGVLVSTNPSGKLQLFLSSGGPNASAPGSGWDIANGLTGADTLTATAWHHVELTYDGTTYRLFLDGTVEVSQTSSGSIVWPDGAAMAVGAQVGIASSTAGYFDEFDFVPFARNVSTFVPPSSPYTISGDWFDSTNQQMKTATSAGPVWSVIQRLYIAEVQTNGSAVTAAYSYSPATQFRGNTFAVNNSTLKVRSGNYVYYIATPQFITNSTTVGAPVTWVLTPAQVPPDATAFYVQLEIWHAAIASVGGVGVQDCSFTARLPVGLVQNYGLLGTAFANYTGFGNPTPATTFTEGAGTVLRVPVINGVASLETIITGPGTQCLAGGGNGAEIKSGVLIGYDMP
jgi:hypothetical protein